jgi:regulatory protein
MDEGVVTALETQKRNKQRVNVYLNGEYAFSLSIDEAAKLHKGQTLSSAAVSHLRSVDSVVQAVDKAARLLALRPRSEAEMRTYLAEKEIAPPVIELAVERLQALGYLDDRAFAAFWVRERTTFKPISPRALKFELQQKGVPADIIVDALADLDSADSAERAARSRLSRLRGCSRRQFRDKLASFLAGRGFGYDDIRATTRLLIEELESDDPGYFASADRAEGDEPET